MTRQEKQLKAAYQAIVNETSRYSNQPQIEMVPECSHIRINPAVGESCIYNPEYFFKVADVFGLSSFIKVQESLPYIIIF